MLLVSLLVTMLSKVTSNNTFCEQFVSKLWAGCVQKKTPWEWLKGLWLRLIDSTFGVFATQSAAVP